MRYEEQLEEIKGNSEKLQAFLCDYMDIQRILGQKLEEEGNTVFFSEITDLIIEISNYILQSERELQERIGAIMGGKVLELRTDRIIAQGLQQGIQQGISKGESRLARLVSKLLAEGRIQEVGIVAENEEVRKEFYKKYGIIDEVENN